VEQAVSVTLPPLLVVVAAAVVLAFMELGMSVERPERARALVALGALEMLLSAVAPGPVEPLLLRLVALAVQALNGRQRILGTGPHTPTRLRQEGLAAVVAVGVPPTEVEIVSVVLAVAMALAVAAADRIPMRHLGRPVEPARAA
jgi:hypothetical protein